MTADQKFISDQYERIQHTLDAVQLERMQQTEEISPLKKDLEDLTELIKQHIKETKQEIKENREDLNKRLTEIELMVSQAATFGKWAFRIGATLGAIGMFLLTFASKFSEWYDKLKTK